MSNATYQVKDSIIGFIDILGSSEAIKNDAEGSLNVVHSAYENAIEFFNGLFGPKSFTPDVKIFSDNIVVAVAYGEEKYKESAFLAVAMMCGVIQVEFLKKGWLTRGGIAQGSFFADEVMVWGTALVKAYKLESSIAVYPRIVIEPELIGDLKLALGYNHGHSKEWIRQDKDGLFYIEYLNRCLKNADLFILGLFGTVEENLAKYHGNTKVCQKWLWLNSYLNDRLAEMTDKGGEESNA